MTFLAESPGHINNAKEVVMAEIGANGNGREETADRGCALSLFFLFFIDAK